MGPHASKMRYSGILGGCFDPKKMIMTSVCVRNLTFERFLMIFAKKMKTKSQEKNKKHKKGRRGSKLRLSELKSRQNIAKKMILTLPEASDAIFDQLFLTLF